MTINVICCCLLEKVFYMLFFPIAGLILPNGDINWDCPCLGGMASGPCGVEFRNAFSCFHYSKAEPKGSDCYEAFLSMQECMSNYPSLYPPAKASVSDELGQLEASESFKLDTVSGDEIKEHFNSGPALTKGES